MSVREAAQEVEALLGVLLDRVGSVVALDDVELHLALGSLEDGRPVDIPLADFAESTGSPPIFDTEEAPRPAGTLAARAQQQRGRTESPQSSLRLRLRAVAPTDIDLAEFIRMVTARPFFHNVELVYSHERQQQGRLMREFEVTFTMDLAPGEGR